MRTEWENIFARRAPMSAPQEQMAPQQRKLPSAKDLVCLSTCICIVLLYDFARPVDLFRCTDVFSHSLPVSLRLSVIALSGCIGRLVLTRMQSTNWAIKCQKLLQSGSSGRMSTCPKRFWTGRLSTRLRTQQTTDRMGAKASNRMEAVNRMEATAVNHMEAKAVNHMEAKAVNRMMAKAEGKAVVALATGRWTTCFKRATLDTQQSTIVFKRMLR